LKKWSRAKKVVLINRLNPSWSDLDADVLLHDGQPQEISRLRFAPLEMTAGNDCQGLAALTSPVHGP
jgi:hypothetical protein